MESVMERDPYSACGHRRCQRQRLSESARNPSQVLVRDLRPVDVLLSDIGQRMSAALDDHGSQLRGVDGVGAILQSA